MARARNYLPQSFAFLSFVSFFSWLWSSSSLRWKAAATAARASSHHLRRKRHHRRHWQNRYR